MSAPSGHWYCFDCDATWDTFPPDEHRCPVCGLVCPFCGSRRVDDDDDIGRFPLSD